MSDRGRMAASVSIDQIASLLYLEAGLLDERKYADWLRLYSKEIEYWVPIRVGQTSPHDEVSIFHENRGSLEFRVERLLHPDVHIQLPPSRTCRQVSNVMFANWTEQEGYIQCQSKLVVHEYRPQLPQMCFAATCYHAFEREDGALKIARKKVILINSDAALPPLSFPF
jgi:3-phenylpropionate/cinnamic acid dioxygenase small subunit